MFIERCGNIYWEVASGGGCPFGPCSQASGEVWRSQNVVLQRGVTLFLFLPSGHVIGCLGSIWGVQNLAWEEDEHVISRGGWSKTSLSSGTGQQYLGVRGVCLPRSGGEIWQCVFNRRKWQPTLASLPGKSLREAWQEKSIGLDLIEATYLHALTSKIARFTKT